MGVRQKAMLSSVLVILFILISCAPAAAPAPAPAPQASAPSAKAPAPTPAAAAKPTWQQEWETTREAARKEGTLVFYTTVADYRTSMASALKKYGINLETIIGAGGNLSEKVFAERRGGIYSGDAYTSGSTTVLSLKRGNALAPMEPMLMPDVKDPKMWWNDFFPWVDDEHYIVSTLTDIKAPITINPNVVKPGEVTSYRDLLNPKWKEKIIIQDPSISGGGGKWFGATLTVGLLDEKYMRQLAEQKPVITRDRRLQVEWLAHGKMAIAIAAQSATLTTFMKAGAQLEAVRPAEGTYISGTSGALGLIGKAAHPNAAKFFVNWYLSQEGQTIVAQTIGAQSRRLDVPTDYLDPDAVRKPGVKYVDTEDEKTLEKVETYYTLARDVFAIK